MIQELVNAYYSTRKLLSKKPAEEPFEFRTFPATDHPDANAIIRKYYPNTDTYSIKGFYSVGFTSEESVRLSRIADTLYSSGDL